MPRPQLIAMQQPHDPRDFATLSIPEIRGHLSGAGVLRMAHRFVRRNFFKILFISGITYVPGIWVSRDAYENMVVAAAANPEAVTFMELGFPIEGAILMYLGTMVSSWILNAMMLSCDENARVDFRHAFDLVVPVAPKLLVLFVITLGLSVGSASIWAGLPVVVQLLLVYAPLSIMNERIGILMSMRKSLRYLWLTLLSLIAGTILAVFAIVLPVFVILFGAYLFDQSVGLPHAFVIAGLVAVIYSYTIGLATLLMPAFAYRVVTD